MTRKSSRKGKYGTDLFEQVWPFLSMFYDTVGLLTYLSEFRFGFSF